MTETPAAASAPAAIAAPPKLIVTIENLVHSAEIEVEKGWAWVEGEFRYLSGEARVAFNWVQNEDPQLAALVKQLFVGWESDAANAAQAASGALGAIITNEGATIETGVANFAQAVLGKIGASGGGASKAAITLLVTQGEGVLLSLLKSSLAKVLGLLLAAS